MKKTIKKTAATIILLTIGTINVLAEGEQQCPKLVAPTVDKELKIDISQKSDDYTVIILELLKNINFLF